MYPNLHHRGTEAQRGGKGKKKTLSLCVSVYPNLHHRDTEAQRGDMERKKICVSESLCTLIFTTETQRHRGEGIWERKKTLSL